MFGCFIHFIGAISPRKDGGGETSPRSNAAYDPKAPPPLPKKNVDLQDFIFCLECGAKNKLFRKVCVSCETELEVPEVLKDAVGETALKAKVKVKAKPSAEHSTVEGEGIESGPQRAEGKGKFVLVLRDKEGEEVGEGGHNVEVQIEGPSGEVQANIRDRRDGRYEVEYDQAEPGLYQLMVLLGEEEVAEAPYEVDVLLVVSAANSSAKGQGLEDGVFAKQKAEFAVNTRDVCGRPCLNGGAIVEVTAELDQQAPASPRSPRAGEDGVECQVEDEGNGSYLVTICYPTHGTYSVEVLVNGGRIQDSPFAVKVDKPPSAGSKWQARFEAEAEERRKERERERQNEIEEAKKNFLEQAEEAKRAAAEKVQIV